MRDQLAVTGEDDGLGLIGRYIHRDLPATVIVEGLGTRSPAIGSARAGSGAAPVLFRESFAPSAAWSSMITSMVQGRSRGWIGPHRTR